MERNVTLDFVRGVAILGILLQYQRLRLAEGRLSQSRTGQEARPLAMPRTGRSSTCWRR